MAGTVQARGPRALAASLAKVTAPLVRRRGFREVRVVSDWPELVGPALAAHSVPERLSRDGVLKVRVASGWALDLAHLEPLLIERIATFYGYRAVTRLALVQGPVPRPEAPAKPAPRPLTAAEEAALEGSLAAVEDGGLKAALAALGRAVLGGRGGA